MESNQSSSINLSAIPGGADAFEKVAKFCYNVNFEITINNVAALRCAAEFLEMEEDYFEGNLAFRTEEFLNRAAMKSLPSTVAVLKSCEKLLPMAEDLKIVQRCVDALSMKVRHRRNFKSPSFAICRKLLSFFRSASSPNSRLALRKTGGRTSSQD